MHPVELAGLPPRTAVATDQGAVLAAHCLQHIVGAVDENKEILLSVETLSRVNIDERVIFFFNSLQW